MQRQMLKSKIHRATVTDCDVDYIGSITIDTELMASADLITNEQVHVWDIDNGARFVTYVIDGEPGSRTMQVNGAAAHLTRPGHKIIVASFGAYDESDLEAYSPVVVHVDDDNEIVAVDSHPEVLLAEPTTRPTRRWPDELRRPLPHRAAAAGPPAGEPAAPGRDEGQGRTDRDGHRLRLPLGQGRRGGRRRHRPGRRLGGQRRARPQRHRGGDDGGDARPRQSGAPRPEDAADGRRHADGQLRGEQRAGDPERPAPGQGDRLPDGQAGGGGDLGRARPGDRPLRHPGDGPRRPHARRPRPRSAATKPRARPRRARSSSARTPSPCRRSAASRSSSRPSPPPSPRRSSRSWRSR